MNGSFQSERRIRAPFPFYYLEIDIRPYPKRRPVFDALPKSVNKDNKNVKIDRDITAAETRDLLSKAGSFAGKI